MFDELYGDPVKLEQFMAAMDAVQFGNAHALAEKFDFSRYDTICDVGGATGQLCTVLAARHLHLHCISFDLPAVHRLLRRLSLPRVWRAAWKPPRVISSPILCPGQTSSRWETSCMTGIWTESWISSGRPMRPCRGWRIPRHRGDH